MANTLPPPPIVKDLPYSLTEWLRKVWTLLGGSSVSGTIPWVQVSKAGSNLTDLPTRNHNDLQNKQGGSGTEYYHLTSAQNSGLTGGTSTTLHTHDHNNLASIQGGTAGQYNHLTNTEYALVNSTQSAGTVLCGPISGAAAVASFKAVRTVKWKDSDTSRNTTTTLADDPDLLFAINANEKWIGRCFLDATAALKTTGIKLTIAGPTGSSGNIHLMLATDATAAQEVFVSNTNTLGTAIDITAGSLPASATQAYIEITWRVANGANAGNISVQWAQSTSSGTNLTIGAGSQLQADRVA